VIAGTDLLGKLAGLLLLACIIFAMIVMVFAPIEMMQKADAETWPSRRGVITTSTASDARNARNIFPWWRVEICGTYRDNGEDFCITRIRFGRLEYADSRASALEKVAKYPIGREVDVYYSPQNPKLTVLVAKSSWGEMIALVAIVGFFLLLPVLLWVFRKQIEPGRYGRV
jgi:uncharacterized pyridoxamine 5'-phosphate oxidase family protein